MPLPSHPVVRCQRHAPQPDAGAASCCSPGMRALHPARGLECKNVVPVWDGNPHGGVGRGGTFFRRVGRPRARAPLGRPGASPPARGRTRRWAPPKSQLTSGSCLEGKGGPDESLGGPDGLTLSSLVRSLTMLILCYHRV